MVKKKTSTHDEADSVEGKNLAFQPGPSLARESLELNLSEGQRQTILKYAELPAHLSERLAGKGTVAKATPFTLDELDELLDHVEVAVYRAKGNEKQKVLRIVEKVAKRLGSTIDPDEMSTGRLAKKDGHRFSDQNDLEEHRPSDLATYPNKGLHTG